MLVVMVAGLAMVWFLYSVALDRDPVKTMHEKDPELLLRNLFNALQQDMHAFPWLTQKESLYLFQYSDTGEDPVSVNHWRNLLLHGIPQHEGMDVDIETLKAVARCV